MEGYPERFHDATAKELSDSLRRSLRAGPYGKGTPRAKMRIIAATVAGSVEARLFYPAWEPFSLTVVIADNAVAQVRLGLNSSAESCDMMGRDNALNLAEMLGNLERNWFEEIREQARRLVKFYESRQTLRHGATP